MSDDKRAFEVGQWVEVQAVVESKWKPNPETDRSEKVLERTPLIKPVQGKIVGFTYRKEGYAKRRFYEEPKTFVSTGSKGVWQVLQGLMNNPIDVFAGDLTSLEREGKLPIKAQNWSDIHIEIFKENAERAARDEEGRFVSLQDAREDK